MMKQLFIILAFSFSIPVIAQQSEKGWETIFEKSGYVTTEDYNQTMEYFQSLADNSEFADLLSFGVSPQGRELKYLLVTNENLTNEKMLPQSRKRELVKPIIFINNGIHSGEIEGKDASMILLREILITKEKEYLLDSINIIVVPIFNVDGHERKSK